MCHLPHFRAKHKAGKLKLNSELCTIAQKWAEHLASISTLQHSSNNYKGQPLGENIASKWGSNGADYSGELLNRAVLQCSNNAVCDWTPETSSIKIIYNIEWFVCVSRPIG